eukprot:UN28593
MFRLFQEDVEDERILFSKYAGVVPLDVGDQIIIQWRAEKSHRWMWKFAFVSELTQDNIILDFNIGKVVKNIPNSEDLDMGTLIVNLDKLGVEHKQFGEESYVGSVIIVSEHIKDKLDKFLAYSKMVDQLGSTLRKKTRNPFLGAWVRVYWNDDECWYRAQITGLSVKSF